MNDHLILGAIAVMIAALAIYVLSKLIENMETFTIVVVENNGPSKQAIEAWKSRFICYACKNYGHILEFSIWANIADLYSNEVYKNEKPEDVVQLELVKMKAYHG